MPKEITRRELMRSITAVGLFVAGTMTPLSSIVAAQTGKVRTRGPQKQRPSAPRAPQLWPTEESFNRDASCPSCARPTFW